jgi:hypothetical protein
MIKLPRLFAQHGAFTNFQTYLAKTIQIIVPFSLGGARLFTLLIFPVELNLRP